MNYCGECCWFHGEDTDGYGFCPFLVYDMSKCDDRCRLPLKFVSKKAMRHFRAVLIQANRYRRVQSVPSIYRMPDVRELGRAIDFASEYIKVFSEL